MSQDPDVEPPAPPNSPRDEPVVVRRGPGLRDRFSGIRDSHMTSVEDVPMNRQQELEDVRRITASQTALKPLPKLERSSALPPITRKGGKYRKRGKKTKRRR
jgi:hypothetical protein